MGFSRSGTFVFLYIEEEGKSWQDRVCRGERKLAMFFHAVEGSLVIGVVFFDKNRVRGAFEHNSSKSMSTTWVVDRTRSLSD